MISPRHIPRDILDDATQCPDCHGRMEVDEGLLVHVATGTDECEPKVFGWVKYDQHRIVEIICDQCVMYHERRTINARPEGVLPVTEPGTIVCARCKEVA